MTLLDIASVALLITGGAFFVAGTIGILRFPNALARLHAVTKADNLGLGFITFGLVFQAESLLAIAKLLLIWLLALTASAVSGFLVGGTVAAEEHGGWP